MKKKVIIGIIAIVLLAIALIVYNASHSGESLDNYPYEPDTPAPQPHDGNFVSEHGRMAFNGDGETVIIDFDAELAELTGLPEGEQSASYAFLSGDLPPHGSMEIRYDVAHELRITLGDNSVVLDLGLASGDGSSAQSGVGTVTEERIPLLFRTEKFFTVNFVKEG